MTAPVAVRPVEDADLVVGQVDPVEPGVAGADRGPQGGVDGVDRPVALGDLHVTLGVGRPVARHPHLDGGLGREVPLGSSSVITRIDSTRKNSCSLPPARRMSSSSEASAASKW